MTIVTPADRLAARPFDVVVFGATGFTGKLVAEYFARHAADNGVTWAIAGRSKSKLEALRRELAIIEGSLAELPMIVADSHDAQAMERLATEARVVCTTVGPFAKHGLELARACARQGTSYCDLTGEPPFVRTLIDELHDLARATEARLVPCSGFDSIPSDLGVFAAWDYARRTHGEGLAWCKIFTGRLSGMLSGGTIATMLGIAEAAGKSGDVRQLLFDPHGLDPVRGEAPRDPFEDDQRGVRFDPDVDRWTAPFVMAAVNTRIVRRSHALLREEGGGYGERFLYHEAMSFPRGPAGLAAASAVTAALPAVLAAAALGPTRALLERLVPKPGEGPSREAIERGSFEFLLVAQTESGKRLRGTIRGTPDPGYGATAKMLAETAFSLAKDTAVLERRFGVLTPATALGARLVERLDAAGLTFDVHDA